MKPSEWFAKERKAVVEATGVVRDANTTALAVAGIAVVIAAAALIIVIVNARSK